MIANQIQRAEGLMREYLQIVHNEITAPVHARLKVVMARLHLTFADLEREFGLFYQDADNTTGIVSRWENLAPHLATWRSSHQLPPVEVVREGFKVMQTYHELLQRNRTPQECELLLDIQQAVHEVLAVIEPRIGLHSRYDTSKGCMSRWYAAVPYLKHLLEPVHEQTATA